MPRGKQRSKFHSEPVICPYCKTPVGITLKVEKKGVKISLAKKELKK